MSVVRRYEGGGSAPRPGIGIVQVIDRAEKRAAMMLKWKSSLEVSPNMVMANCGFSRATETGEALL
jgi:flavin reductase (DIM6/NTAB) family NADH-FMN oxidoreductase RutF